MTGTRDGHVALGHDFGQFPKRVALLKRFQDVGVEQFGGFLPRLAEIFVRQVVPRIFRMALMSFTGIRLNFPMSVAPALLHPHTRLPFPLYAPFFKVANKVCKLLYTSLTSLNNRFKVRSSA